jgi:hypothetical protein
VVGNAVGRPLELHGGRKPLGERVVKVGRQVLGEVDEHVRGGVEAEVRVADAEQVGTLLGLQAAVHRLAHLVVRGLLQPDLGPRIIRLEVLDDGIEGVELRGTSLGDEL